MRQFQALLRHLEYAFGMIRTCTTFLLLAACGCSSEIYVRDGVTDGDTFYLSERAFADDDPVLQSWVTYSLARSACQLDIGGDNPARANSYGCEFMARQLMLDSWEGHRLDNPSITDHYLDSLLQVREAGYLDEYVAAYFGKRDWQVPVEVDVDKFHRWRREHLRRHRPETHLIPLVLQVATGERESIRIFGDDYPTPDGTCLRDYVHVSDLTRAHLLALEHLLAGGGNTTFNLGNSTGYSVKQIIETAREITGHAIPAQVEARRAGDPAVLIADSDRIRRELGWQPAYEDVREIIRTAWAWHRKEAGLD